MFMHFISLVAASESGKQKWGYNTVHMQPSVSVYWIGQVQWYATDWEAATTGLVNSHKSIQDWFRNKKSVLDPGWTCFLLLPQMMPEPRPPAGAPLAAPVAGRGPASPKNTWSCYAPPSRLTRTPVSASGRASLKLRACQSHASRYITASTA